eukprot:7229027-Prymnesium_polylepis.2
MTEAGWCTIRMLEDELAPSSGREGLPAALHGGNGDWLPARLAAADRTCACRATFHTVRGSASCI